MSRIPKIIHYCWFGRKPMPELAVKCIESWKKYLPDWQIMRWDESNFDIASVLHGVWVREHARLMVKMVNSD